uniref:Transposase n=1 Tax=Heterorhabditis bacteriophora TaxID=37862 RepID=A0A1I7WLB3_HETBA
MAELWAWLESRVYSESGFNSIDDLEQRVIEVLNEIIPEMLKKWCSEFNEGSRRLLQQKEDFYNCDTIKFEFRTIKYCAVS